jgi:8-oxo-dGTP pyrophosphatase MutT (NUDIX family)
MENSSLMDIDCSGALICSRTTHRFLLLQKREGKHAGRWGLVGGTNLSGETAWQGLQREIEEELGYRIGYVEELSFLNITYKSIYEDKDKKKPALQLVLILYLFRLLNSAIY